LRQLGSRSTSRPSVGSLRDPDRRQGLFPIRRHRANHQQ
jgi:hypothetical protein